MIIFFWSLKFYKRVANLNYRAKLYYSLLEMLLRADGVATII
jgi:hypothetical protein